MPLWHCPYCGTLQAEAARCWVCQKSTTSCATCRHFRRAVAGHLGYCGVDRRRSPLRGDEIRGCWETATVPVETTGPADTPPGEAPQPVRSWAEIAPITPTSTIVSPGRGGSSEGPARATDRIDPTARLTDTPRGGGPSAPAWRLWGDREP